MRAKRIAAAVRRRVLPMERDHAYVRWLRDSGDETLRQEFELCRESLVFDMGGFKGQWASDMFARYQFSVWVFEPIPAFAQAVERRFKSNAGIRVFHFGLQSDARRAFSPAVKRNGERQGRGCRRVLQTALGPPD